MLATIPTKVQRQGNSQFAQISGGLQIAVSRRILAMQTLEMSALRPHKDQYKLLQSSQQENANNRYLFVYLQLQEGYCANRNAQDYYIDEEVRNFVSEDDTGDFVAIRCLAAFVPECVDWCALEY
jgi:hypothetical protein